VIAEDDTTKGETMKRKMKWAALGILGGGFVAAWVYTVVESAMGGDWKGVWAMVAIIWAVVTGCLAAELTGPDKSGAGSQKTEQGKG
jgi:hypothetical protein